MCPAHYLTVLARDRHLYGSEFPLLPFVRRYCLPGHPSRISTTGQPQAMVGESGITVVFIDRQPLCAWIPNPYPSISASLSVNKQIADLHASAFRRIVHLLDTRILEPTHPLVNAADLAILSTNSSHLYKARGR
jgi:hypothetical protein